MSAWCEVLGGNVGWQTISANAEIVGVTPRAWCKRLGGNACVVCERGAPRVAGLGPLATRRLAAHSRQSKQRLQQKQGEVQGLSNLGVVSFTIGTTVARARARGKKGNNRGGLV